MDIGIDLGTTYSVLAVKGKVKLNEDYGEGEYIEEFDTTIIPTPDGENSFPSVLWINSDDPDDYLVGYDAKEKVNEGMAPVMFSKRSIGTDKLLDASGHQITATQAATRMLAYFKLCAEQALGESVDRAVVTHPAYFNPNQIAETRHACNDAGLVIDQDEQLLMEPAAAALAYLNNRDEDALTVLTYDLGGGTFDVTVLERVDGVISMIAFDGNELLGGYDFDKALIRWILQKAEEKGRKVSFDENDPEHRARYARLLTIAESVKFELAEKRNDKAKVLVRIPDAIKDVDGKTVPVSEKISRAEFSELIRDELKRTFECCDEALRKAEKTAEDLDVILLVGGSTYGPWVAAGLHESYPALEVERAEPDLCVAAGAAIQASQMAPVSQGAGYCLMLNTPPVTPINYIDIQGVVQNADRSALSADDAEALCVALRGPDKVTIADNPVAANGSFRFPQIDLPEDGTNCFDIALRRTDGGELLVNEFQITYDPDGVGVDIHTVMPKQLLVETRRGLIPLVEEGETLPATIKEEYTRIHDGDRLAIRLLIEGDDVGTITIKDIPAEAGRGAGVTLNLQVTQRNQLIGHAEVKSLEGAVVARSQVDIAFPPISLPDLAVLWTQFEDLNDKREDLAVNSPDPAHRIVLAGKALASAEEIKKLLEEQMPDVQKIQQRIRELNKLVNPEKVDMIPPHASFLDLVNKCTAAIATKEGVEAESAQKTLDLNQTKGEDAFAAKNQRNWTLANENLEALYQQLSSEDDTSPQDLPPTPELKSQAMHMVEQQRSNLETQDGIAASRADYESALRPRVLAIGNELDEAERNIRAVDDNLDPRSALAKIQRAVRRLPEIQEKIAALFHDV